jgi:hypothetical protein
MYCYDICILDCFIDGTCISYFLTYASTINEAIQNADIVTVHIPASKENDYLFDELGNKPFSPSYVSNAAPFIKPRSKASINALVFTIVQAID